MSIERIDSGEWFMICYYYDNNSNGSIIIHDDARVVYRRNNTKSFNELRRFGHTKTYSFNETFYTL